jgi:hypothetical protein
MHKVVINLSIYFFLTCFGLSFSPYSEAGVQIRQWFKTSGYGVCTRFRMEIHPNLDAETILKRLQPLPNLYACL